MTRLSIRGVEPGDDGWWMHVAASLATALFVINTYRLAEAYAGQGAVVGWTIGVASVLAGLGVIEVLHRLMSEHWTEG